MDSKLSSKGEWLQADRVRMKGWSLMIASSVTLFVDGLLIVTFHVFAPSFSLRMLRSPSTFYSFPHHHQSILHYRPFIPATLDFSARASLLSYIGSATGGYGTNAQGSSFSRQNQIGADSGPHPATEGYLEDDEPQAGFATGTSTPGYRQEGGECF